MVKIIGRDEAVVKRVTCRECAAILEYTPSETKESNGTDYSGGSAGTQWVDCPNGHKAIIRSW